MNTYLIIIKLENGSTAEMEITVASINLAVAEANEWYPEAVGMEINRLS